MAATQEGLRRLGGLPASGRHILRRPRPGTPSLPPGPKGSGSVVCGGRCPMALVLAANLRAAASAQGQARPPVSGGRQAGDVGRPARLLGWSSALAKQNILQSLAKS